MKDHERVDFHTSLYFPQPVRAGAALAMLLVFLPQVHIILKFTLAVASLAVLTAHYRLRFDKRNKEYYDYVWLLGLRRGEHLRFDKIEYLFIKRNKVRQTVYSMMSSTTIHSEVYDAFLRISEDNKIHLFSSRNRDSALKRLKALSLLLGVDILDYTGE
jgi:hypothetical protein